MQGPESAPSQPVQCGHHEGTLGAQGRDSHCEPTWVERLLPGGAKRGATGWGQAWRQGLRQLECFVQILGSESMNTNWFFSTTMLRCFYDTAVVTGTAFKTQLSAPSFKKPSGMPRLGQILYFLCPCPLPQAT